MIFAVSCYDNHHTDPRVSHLHDLNRCVLFGRRLNHWIAPLRRWNIPEAVTGGLLAAVVTLVAYRAFGLAVTFDLGARDMLLVSAFFIDLANAPVIGLFVR